MDLTVETSGTEQGRVENFDAVCSRKDNDTRVCAETVHFGEQLVQRIFAFIVTPH